MSTQISQALQQCANEPIHVPGSVQPHGVLFALSKDMVIQQVSTNTDAILEKKPEDLLGCALKEVLGKENKTIESLAHQSGIHSETINLNIGHEIKNFDAVIHHADDMVILELEPVIETRQTLSFQEMHAQLGAFAAQLQNAKTSEEQSQIAAEEMRKLTGFGRVKVYQFDQDWNGRVIAESKEERMDSYMGQYFPASDIPEQARALYTKNPIRLIADVNYEPARIISAYNDSKPLDLTFSTLRSVSPVHLQYLRNMDIASSMSVSILQDGKLWGLICCHDDRSNYVPYPVRIIAELMANIVAPQLSVLRNAQQLAYEEKAQRDVAHITARLRDQTKSQTIENYLPEMMKALNASGIILKRENQIQTSGVVPETESLQKILHWAQKEKKSGPLSTHELATVLNLDQNTLSIASGIMASPIGSDNMLLWLRPEIIQHLKWAGNPNAKEIDSKSHALTPRKSFSLWEETVKGKAQPWTQVEIEAAQYLADAVHTYQIDKELKRSNEELERFAYIASHDLQEPLRMVANFTTLLEDEYKDKLDEHAGKYMRFAIDAAFRMQNLVNDLLEYSRADHDNDVFSDVDCNNITQEALDNLHALIDETKAKIEIGDLPVIYANSLHFSRLMQNLVENALKYKSPDRIPNIIIQAKDQGDTWLFSIQDNGIGMNPDYLEQIFAPFKRLHGKDDYSGTGIGLAACKKIVENFGGQIWVSSKPDQGSIFYFTAPKPQSVRKSA